MSGHLSRWPVGHQVGEVFDGWAAAGFDVKTAGADAGEETEFVIKAEKLAEAEAGIEVVAGAGGDDRFGDDRTLNEIDFAF